MMGDVIHTRYMLLPYFYPLFREVNTSGVLVMWPLWMEFPTDEVTFSNDEAFMVGRSLLVQGIFIERAKHASIWLPWGQSWYDLRSGVAYKGGVTHKMEVSEESIPAFQRVGTIIPRNDKHRRSSTQMVNDPFTLVVTLNDSLTSEGELYVDDGKSFEFEKSAYIHRRFVFSDGKLVSSNMAHISNKFSSDCVIERIILLGLPHGSNCALVEPRNHKVDIELGPPIFHGRKGPTVLTIRKPNVRVTDDWTINIL